MLLIQKLINKEEFTESENCIADFILNNKEKFLQMTIGELATATFTCNPTIIRMCQKLDFQGFREFKIAFAYELNKFYSLVQDVDDSIPFHSQENYKEIAKKLCDLTKQVVDNCFFSLSTDEIDKAANILDESQTINVYAFGDSYIRALSFKNKLLKINKHVNLVNDYHEEAYHLSNTSINDCVLYVSHSGVISNFYYSHAKIYKERNIKQIFITSNYNAPLFSLCDAKILILSHEEDSKKIATFASQIAIEYILNVLYSCVFEINYNINLEYKQKNYDFLLSNDLIQSI